MLRRDAASGESIFESQTQPKESSPAHTHQTEGDTLIEDSVQGFCEPREKRTNKRNMT